jgi:Na+/melibiose symporter-like transporter
VLRRSAPFRTLLGAFILQALATGLMLAAANYVAEYVLRSSLALTLLFVALVAPAIACAPLWSLVSQRLGKERSFVLASGLYCLAGLLLTGLLVAPGDWVYLPVTLAGAAYAGMQALPLAMLPDVVSHDALTHGDGHAGVFAGVWTMSETGGMALGVVLLTLVLAASGYVESTGSQIAAQPDSAIAGIVLAFSVVPAVLVGLSLVSLGGYRLRRADLEVVPEEAG